MFLVKEPLGPFYSDHRGVYLENVGFTLHDFMSRNFPYRYSETLHVCAYLGHTCACSVYAYAYLKACVHMHRVFPTHFLYQNYPSSKSLQDWTLN